MSELPDVFVCFSLSGVPVDAVTWGESRNPEYEWQPYVPASRLADLTRQLEDARKESLGWKAAGVELQERLAERARERDEARADLAIANADRASAQWEVDLWHGRAKSAESRERALREALRAHAIVEYGSTWRHNDGGPPRIVRCNCCQHQWHKGDPEQHAPDCLAALADGGQQG